MGSQRASQRVSIAEPARPDKPAAAARALSTLSKKSLSKAVSTDKPAEGSSSGAKLEAKLSTETRLTPSPIPEEPSEESKAAAAKKAQAPSRPASMKKQQSTASAVTGAAGEKKEEPKPKAPAAPPPQDDAPSTTKARGRSKATGQIVGGWI